MLPRLSIPLVFLILSSPLAKAADAPADKVTLELPSRPTLGWRFYDHVLSTTLLAKGNLGLVKSVRVELFPNHRNHPDEAEKTPTKTLTLAPLKNSNSMKLENVPFGMYVLRVTGLGQDGKATVLLEELVAMLRRPPAQTPWREWAWGIDTHCDRNDRRVDIDMPSLQELGANWARIEFLWRDITDEKGNPDFAHHDYVVREAEKNGIRLFACLTTTARHAETIPGGGWGSPPKLDAYETWCRQVMTHFKGKISHYEILNEPDGYAFWWFGRGMGRPEWHAEMIKIAARVAREVSPDIHIMAPSLTVIGVPYFRRLIDAGAFDDISDISAHFTAARHPRSFHKQLQRMLAERYPDRQFTFWATEGGNWNGTFLANFAEPNPANMFHYVDRDKGTDPANFEHNNGLTKAGGTPKDSYIKHQTVAAYFTNARYVGRALSGCGVEGYLFERNGVYTLGVWSEDPQKGEMVIPSLANQPVTALDNLGNPLPGFSRETGRLPVGDADNITILTGLPQDHDIVTDAAVNCTNDYTMAEPDRPINLVFKLANPTKEKRSYELTLTPPKGWSITPATFTMAVEPGQTKEIHVRADLPADSPSGDVWIEGKLKVGDRIIPKRFGPVWVYNTLRFKHLVIDDFEGPAKWIFPEQIDIHTAGDDWGAKRKAKKLDALIQGNRFSVTPHPVFSGRHAGRFDYGWKKPKDGWGWMACTFALAQPMVLPGKPVELRMKVFMKDINKFDPTTILARFIDSTGQVFQIEGGGEIYWTGWREFRMILPSPLGDGYIHSSWGGAKDGKVHYPLKFAGFIFNRPPSSVLIYPGSNGPSAQGYLVLDDLEIVYYE